MKGFPFLFLSAAVPFPGFSAGPATRQEARAVAGARGEGGTGPSAWQAPVRPAGGRTVPSACLAQVA
jgi:hypothetical protein